MRRELHELLDEVNDEKTFLVFVDALVKDRIDDVRGMKNKPLDDFGRGPSGWENHTVVDFLDAAHAWAESTNIGASQGLANASPWRRFAAFLYGGKTFVKDSAN